jgi:hypothetical protein
MGPVPDYTHLFSKYIFPDSLSDSLDIVPPIASVVPQPPVPQSVKHATICNMYIFT